MQETDSHVTDRTSSRLRLSALGAALAFVSSALVLGRLWSTVAGVTLAVIAVVLGIMALSTLRHVRSRGLIILLAVLALVWGGLNLLGGGARLLVWPASQVYQDCVESSLTISSAQHCERQLNDNVWNHFAGDPLDTTRATGAATSSPSASPTGK